MLKPFPAMLKLDMYSNIEIEYAMLKSNTAKLELIALLLIEIIYYNNEIND